MTSAILVGAAMLSYDMSEEPGNVTSIRTNNYLGIGGVYLSHYLIKMFLGLGSAVIPVLLFIWGFWVFANRNIKALFRFSLLLLVLALLFSTGMALLLGKPWAVPGVLGGLFAGFLKTFLGAFGAWVFVFLTMLLVITGYFGWSLYNMASDIGGPFGKIISSLRRFQMSKKKKGKPIVRESPIIENRTIEGEPWTPPEVVTLDEPPIDSDDNEPELEDDAPPISGEAIEQPDDRIPILADESPAQIIQEGESEIEVKEQIVEEEIDYDAERAEYARREFNLPSVDLLEQAPPVVEDQISREEIMDNAKLLEDTLESFGVSAKVVEVHPGPVITRFELEPAAGVKVSKIVTLSDDIALAMRAKRVRILAPIPGKAAVGVEIPNKNAQIVFLRSVINSEKFASIESPLAIALGKTAAGETICVDLATMPHLLIAGSTGSGKSVCINSIITSMLYKSRPDELKFIMVDPKKLELSTYKNLKNYHLMPLRDVKEDIITKPQLAVIALKSAEVEMERRYDLLADAGVRSIAEYNRKVESEEDMTKLSYLVVIIDELADLMITAAKDIEEPISRLAQMARAVGIHLIVATQRPSVDVLTGVIKANFPARMAFQVSSKTDSRTIIDMNGAEKLLGKGDMLYVPPAEPEAIRVHNSFISLPEIERVLEHIGNQPKYEEKPLPSVRETPLQSGGEGYLEFYGNDSLLPEAMRLVVMHQQGSISLLQRRLKVGYSRAARLIDELENAGVVGPFEGSKAREVLWDEQNLKKNLEQDDDGEES